MAKASDEASLNGADHINQIRDILLGPQRRDYDQRFEQTLADIKSARDEARVRSEQIEGTLKAEIASLQRALDQQARHISATLLEQTAKLQQLITQTDEKTRTDHQHQLEEMRVKLETEMRSTKDQLSRDLEAHAATLRDGKVSRDMLAELLQELAIKLKGVEIVTELRKAARKAQGA
jgi:hypothetical protein